MSNFSATTTKIRNICNGAAMGMAAGLPALFFLNAENNSVANEGQSDDKDVSAENHIHIPPRVSDEEFSLSEEYRNVPDIAFIRPDQSLAEAPPQNSTEPEKPIRCEDEIFDEFLEHLMNREGYRTRVYLDSLGKPTVGVGHLVTPEDNLKVGDVIPESRVLRFLQEDAAKAFDAAKAQAREIGVEDPDFILALGSVNFQLGTGWRRKFPQTWDHISNRRFDQACENLEKSLWNRQTPVRVKDFINALRDLQQFEGMSYNISEYQQKKSYSLV